ncbi:Clavaminate synthase-like protein [Fistulina hepatica ATCC 64428]|uniref:Clavaminate synthase-like protein n=1 Tax=Fistulina hepatica ATCC 64428 TaxID=1128425 RepID=A0A0D7ALF3_9AGAR|nr:Clavaminate synthase-like protein [Fistulina hepatica ATCC 64428]
MISTLKLEPIILAEDGANTPPPLPRWKQPTVTKHELEWADILTVDLSLFETCKEVLVNVVRTALQRDGFFYVTGHGIPQEMIERQFDIGQHVFDGVSQDEKGAYVAQMATQGSYMGYKLKQYWALSNGVRDRVELYNFYQNNFYPLNRHPAPVRPYVGEAHAFLEVLRQAVFRRVLSLIDAVLELPTGYLWLMHENEHGKKSNDYLRYMMYDPLLTEEATKTNGVMLNGHTDFGTITTLLSQPITALQVLMPDGVWRYVKHKEGAMVINIGDQLSFKSGVLLKGTMHRVVCPPPDQMGLRRLGVFHFARFLDGTRLDLFPSKKVQEEGHTVFEGEIPTSDEWGSQRIKSYGVGNFVKNQEYDTETINGVVVSC